MKTLNKLKLIGASALGTAVTGTALADGGEAALSQVNYLGKIGEALSATFMWIAFAISVIVLIGGCVFLIKDYVISKDHEKTFSIGKLLVAMVVAGILAEPTGSYVLGNDLAAGAATGGGQGIKAENFERKTPAG